VFFRKIHNKKIIILLLPVLALVFASCSPDDDSGGNDNNTVTPVMITFWNASRYRVHIYKNLNPENFDPSTLVCTLNSGESQTIEQYPSYDQVIGDVFYPRYMVHWVGSLRTGTTDIYIEAERVLSNIPLVIKSGETYNTPIKINNINVEDLDFFNGYIVVNNAGNTRIQIIRGSSVLTQKDDSSVYINANKTGFYEIPFSYFDTSITMNQLKAFSSYDISFPSFSVEKGKMYIFTVQQNDVVTGPIIKNIWEPF
jgi:hypothetical protein